MSTSLICRSSLFQPDFYMTKIIGSRLPPILPSSPSFPSTPLPLPFLPPLNPQHVFCHRKYLLEKGCMCVCMCVCICVCMCVCVCLGAGAGGTGKILPSPSFLFIHLLPLPHSLSPAPARPVVQVSYSRMHCIWLLMPTTSLS